MGMHNGQRMARRSDGHEFLPMVPRAEGTSLTERLAKFLQATPEKQAAIDRILDGQGEVHSSADPAVPSDRRLLTLTQAAKELGCSRMTVFRMVRDGRLPAVELRAGRRRIPSYALTCMAKGVVAMR